MDSEAPRWSFSVEGVVFRTCMPWAAVAQLSGKEVVRKRNEGNRGHLNQSVKSQPGDPMSPGKFLGFRLTATTSQEEQERGGNHEAQDT